MSSETRLGLAEFIAHRALHILERHNVVDREGHVMEVWPRGDRAVLIIDPRRVARPEKLDAMAHHISSALHGRRVVFTNSRGYFFQVGYKIPPYQALMPRPLDLAAQPSPLHVPIGAAKRGDLWLSIVEMDSVIVGGTRRMGKTMFLHGWIQALIRGGEVDLLLWDGKSGIEFGRYAGQPRVTVADDLDAALRHVADQVNARVGLFAQRGVTNLAAYNDLAADSERLRPCALILDEVAFLPAGASAQLGELIARCGALGVHPILGLQRPDADALAGIIRANASTRIALPCATHADSRLIIGQGGAEKLPKVRGRLLLPWDGRLIEAQAFTVSLPPAPASARPAHQLIGLSDHERQIVLTAVGELGGRFKVRALAQLTGASKESVSDLARRLEARNLLTEVEYDERGRRLGRRVTPALAQFVGLADVSDLSD